jgi:flavin-dependent dehydrogenase
MLERAQVPGEKVISGLVIPFYGFLFGPDFIREGNPPIERPICKVVNRFVRNGEIYATDSSLRVPKPFALGYAAYCKPFCTWLADRAVEAGAELRTSTVAVDLMLEKGRVTGVVTDRGEEIRCKILIDAGGTQNQLAIKAGLRKKYVPEALELYMLWDFEMAKEDVDEVFGLSMEFFHAMPEEKIGAPLGYGSTLYTFTYRESIHPGLGQFLLTQGQIPNVAKLLPQYFENFQQKVVRWKRDIAPRAKLRAVMWDVCPIYAGLLPEMRRMPIYGDGMLIIGDAAGFEASAFGDGVPNAWFSAEIAADVAIEAIRAGDTARSYLWRYEARINDHPYITWIISDRRRWDLREVLASKNEMELRRRIRDHWGIGAFKPKYIGRPLAKAIGRALRKEPGAMIKWTEMFRRYYRNWENNTFDRLSTG